MINMDFKGIMWVGNVYQKFEAMCLEVEEVMYEDTVKYVGNQVQMVGACVKKFYSEVMQDVLPQSCIDPVKVAAADLSVNPYDDFSIHKKPKATIKKEKVSQDLEVTSDQNQNSLELLLEQNKDMGSNGKSRGVTKRKYRREINLQSEVSRSFTPESKKLNRVSKCSEMDKNYGMATDQVDTELCTCKRSDSSQVEDFEYVARTFVSTADKILSSGFVAKEESQLGDPSSQAACGIDAIDSMMRSYISCDPMNTEYGCEDFFPTGDTNVDFIGSDEDIAKLRTERIQEFDKANCVVVGRDDIAVAAPKEDKPRSYKIKIRKALSSKGSARKKEYKHLAVQHCCLDTGASREVPDSSTPELLDEEKLPPHRISDSEWEIL